MNKNIWTGGYLRHTFFPLGRVIATGTGVTDTELRVVDQPVNDHLFHGVSLTYCILSNVVAEIGNELGAVRGRLRASLETAVEYLGRSNGQNTGQENLYDITIN